MAADGGGQRPRTAQAAQACRTCKSRKKKCNRSLPSCAYCVRKDLHCVYTRVRCPGSQIHAAVIVENRHAVPNWGARPSLNVVSPCKVPSEKLPCQVYLEVHGIIRATGQFVDDISARYFQGLHRHLPVISRTRFYKNLINLGAAPAADFSVLLLTICLMTHKPVLANQSPEATGSVEQQSLYLTARSLFAQVQVSCSPSLPLIQASLLLAVYEYTHGRPDDAFVTIAGTARMAYAAGIHACDRHQTPTIHTTGDHNTDPDLLLQAEEAANTWWGIVVCERIFVNEVTVRNQRLLTAFPAGDARLPIELQVLDQLDVLEPGLLPNIPVSCLTSPKVEGFGRTAQATCLLDQVLRCFETSDIDSRLLQLERLDTNIQAFLSLIMPQCQGSAGVFCAAINITMRALFTVHWHILALNPQMGITALFKPLEEWHRRSQEALDSVTKMVVDTAELLVAGSSTYTATQTIDIMPPTYPYLARAALRYIRNQSSAQREDASWLTNAGDVIQTTLDRYSQRWGVSCDDRTQS